MSENSVRVQPQIASMDRYVAGPTIEALAQSIGKRTDELVVLSANENPLGPGPRAREAMVRSALEPERYPDANATELRRAIAQHFGLQEDWVIIGNGSDDLLGLVSHLLLSEKTSCVFAKSSFSVYSINVHQFAAEAIEVPNKGFDIDLDAMAEAIRLDTRLVFVTNPNNPTGLYSGADALKHFLDRVPKDCMVVLDEAYVDFMPKDLRPDSVAWVREYPNLIVMRTFSKAYGLAGLRAGYAIARPEVIELLDRIRATYNMNRIAQAAAAAALEDDAYLQKVCTMVAEERESLKAFFAEQGCRYLESVSNFLMVEFGEKTDHVNKELMKRGILVRGLRGYGYDTWLRITVGSPEQNARLKAALLEIFASE